MDKYLLLQIYAHTHMYTYRHKHAHTHAHKHAHTQYAHTRTQTYARAHTYAHTHARTYTNTHARARASARTYVQTLTHKTNSQMTSLGCSVYRPVFIVTENFRVVYICSCKKEHFNRFCAYLYGNKRTIYNNKGTFATSQFYHKITPYLNINVVTQSEFESKYWRTKDKSTVNIIEFEFVMHLGLNMYFKHVVCASENIE